MSDLAAFGQSHPRTGWGWFAALGIAQFVLGVIAVQHRDMPRWGLMLAGGAVSLLVGVLPYATLPWSGLRIVDTLIAVELIVHGVSWLQFGLALRRSALGRDR